VVLLAADKVPRMRERVPWGIRVHSWFDYMSDIAIRVKNIFKKYRLFFSPKERLKEALHPFRKQYHNEFWALKDVSFDVPKGQTLGILGRNGSGKSTLLQIIASVLQPTSGSIEVNGRVSALLELGAGFNPEFTGRDNVILNGAIQGVSRDEMIERMPEIEAFADIGEFFDQPVKTYSSGMFVRVAFAAAINVDPDILIVDEALAVGDTKFQARCFDAFREFQSLGITIIVVSHDVHMITRLCDRAIVIEHGSINYDGEIDAAVNCYDNLMFGGGEHSIVNEHTQQHDDADENVKTDESTREGFQSDVQHSLADKSSEDRFSTRRSYNAQHTQIGDGRAAVIDYLLVSDGVVDPVRIKRNTCVDLYVKVFFKDSLSNPSFGMAIKTIDGTVIYGTNTKMQGIPINTIQAGSIKVFRCSFYARLASGKYLMNIGIDDCLLSSSQIADARRGIICLEIDAPSDIAGVADFMATFQLVQRDVECEKRTATI